MREIRCSGVLFDLDGVLIDSTPAVTRVWRQWALEHGLIPRRLLRASTAGLSSHGTGVFTEC
jgi:beta-phosphoglucomutase-like phosphatase (HAD superfamily)